ncbi:MAG TPA: sulfatase-like hydrolase/transferase [Planctomycetaceae bacterium]|nr:sulfatase-like hydrolase/transferase [Planctomycetaceae bacterium]
MQRLILLAAILWSTASVWSAASAAETADARPNVLVILCDDLGYGDLACYGHPHIRTPNLDRLAADGLRLTSWYSAAPVCSPSRVGLLTGRDPNRAGVYDWIPAVGHGGSRAEGRHQVHLRREEVTLPALLQQAGYATAMAGKWHCNSQFNRPDQPQPGDAGFDHWFATQNNAAPSHENPTNFVRNGTPAGPLEGYSCRLVAREAIEWLERQRRHDADQPFFLYVAFHEPHEPVASPPDLVRTYLDSARNEDEAQYFANVANIDVAVGELLAALARLGVADDTLVVFTSDNGPETLNRYRGSHRSYGSPGPLRGMKLWTTEAGFRVPGIVRWPAKIPAGQVSDEPVSSLDLLPTLCALAGAKLPSGLALDGADARAVCNGGTVERHRPLFWVYYNALNEQRVALRDGPWKLLARLDHGELPKITNVTTATAPRVREAKLTEFSLYRLDRDTGEARDLAAAEPKRVQQMAARMEELYRELTSTMHVWPEQ